MNTPNIWQKVADHFRAFVWAGRPVAIRYLDRNNYFRDPTKFGGSGEMICDGSCTVRRGVSTIRIFLPILPEADRQETLRHECGHIRFHFVPRPSAALSEARRLFRDLEPEDAALYAAQGEDFDMSGEAVVRLADRVRSGQPVPSMSTPLAELVRAVVAPAPASAMGFVFLVVALAALVSSASAAPAADLIAREKMVSAGGVIWGEGTCIREGGGAIVGQWAWPGRDDLKTRLDAAALGYVEGMISCGEYAALCAASPGQVIERDIPQPAAGYPASLRGVQRIECAG